MGDLAVEDVGHGLEPAVRVPRRALGLVRPVDRAEVVEQQERIGLAACDSPPGTAANLEAGALDGVVRGDDPGDHTPSGSRRGAFDSGENE